MSESPRNILWVASYPKSGNTWVRFLLCNLLYGRQDSAASLNLLCPDVHELGAQIANSSNGGLVKTHFAYSEALPLAARTAGAIYVVREPADVLISNFHYSRRSGAETGSAQGDLDRYFETFVEAGGDPRWIRLGMGAWADNVRSWLGRAHSFPVIWIRYEDLSADPEKVCTQLAAQLRPNSTPEEIQEAVANSSFRRMREVEEADIRDKRVGIFYKPYLESAIGAGVRFMRSGAVGEGAARLSAEQRTRLRRTIGPILGELGYQTA